MVFSAISMAYSSALNMFCKLESHFCYAEVVIWALDPIVMWVFLGCHSCLVYGICGKGLLVG